MSETKTRKTRGPNALGAAARRQIVAAAEQVLKRDGFQGLSTRRVAEQGGISVGNLTYHFPSKDSLLQAVMADVCARYAARRGLFAAAPGETPRRTLRRALAWLFEDAMGADTSALFLELWVMAKRSPAGAEVVDGFYADAVGWVREGLAEAYPGAEARALDRAAHLVMTLCEGSTALYSRTTRWPGGVEDLAETAITAVEAVLSPAP